MSGRWRWHWSRKPQVFHAGSEVIHVISSVILIGSVVLSSVIGSSILSRLVLRIRHGSSGLRYLFR